MVVFVGREMCVELILARVAFAAEVAVEGCASCAGGFSECGWVGDAAGWHGVVRDRLRRLT